MFEEVGITLLPVMFRSGHVGWISWHPNWWTDGCLVQEILPDLHPHLHFRVLNPCWSMIVGGLPSSKQTWMAGKSPIHGGFHRKIIDWLIVHYPLPCLLTGGYMCLSNRGLASVIGIPFWNSHLKDLEAGRYISSCWFHCETVHATWYQGPQGLRRY